MCPVRFVTYVSSRSDAMRTTEIKVDEMVTHTMPLSNINEAIVPQWFPWMDQSSVGNPFCYGHNGEQIPLIQCRHDGYFHALSTPCATEEIAWRAEEAREREEQEELVRMSALPYCPQVKTANN